MKACFIGHRNIDRTETLKSKLKETVLTLINKGVTTFLFGSMSDFDKLSLEVVSELKNDYPLIKRIYVRSSFQHIDKFYEEYLLKSYEETYFPTIIENSGKYAYVERNYEMINNSKFCVFYYDKNHSPLSNNKTSSIRRSGTKIAYEYATKNKKEIVNIYEII